MEELSFSKLEGYVEQCKLLKRDLELVLEDDRFATIPGGVTCFAVDHSEIFSYVLRDMPNEDYSLFLARSPQDRLAMQLLTFAKLFDQVGAKLVLLPPYAIEFDGFLHGLREKAFDDLMQESLLAFEQAEQVASSDEFARIRSLAQDLQKTAREPTDKEKQALVHFLERECPDVLSLLAAARTAPFERVRSLFDRAVFEKLADLVGEVIDARRDNEVASACLERLNAARGKKSHSKSLLDSIAIALVDRANQILNPSNMRLLLVTRSKHMLDAVEQEVRSGTLIRYQSSFLRHPRVLYLQAITNWWRREPLRQTLREELNLIDLFLKSATGLDTLSASALAELEPQRKGILQRWHWAEGLEASLATLHLGIGRPAAEELLPLLRLFETSAALKEAVVKRLDEIGHYLEERHEFLGLCFQSMSPENQETLKGKLIPERFPKETEMVSEDHPQKYVLRTSLDAFPYTFQLSLDAGSQLLEALGSVQQYDWQDFLHLYRKGSWEVTDYERVLLIAFVLGTLGKWSLAELYCERALDLAKREQAASPHEGFFFQAICHRRWNLSPDRLRRGLELIDRAIETKRALRGFPTYCDPRYLKEQGTLILLLHMEYADRIDASVPPVARAMELFSDAFDLSRDDVDLRIQIVNNRLYYYTEMGIRDDPTAVETEFHRLLSLQREVTEDESLWPAFVLDTAAWSQLVLFGAHREEEQHIILTRLQTAQARKEITARDRQRVREHLRRYQEWLGAGCPRVDWLGWLRPG